MKIGDKVRSTSFGFDIIGSIVGVNIPSRYIVKDDSTGFLWNFTAEELVLMQGNVKTKEEMESEAFALSTGFGHGAFDEMCTYEPARPKCECGQKDEAWVKHSTWCKLSSLPLPGVE